MQNTIVYPSKFHISVTSSSYRGKGTSATVLEGTVEGERERMVKAEDGG